MKRYILIILALCLSCMAANAQFFHGLGVKSYKVTSAWPTSFRSVKGSVQATISNTDETRSIRNVRATLYRNGKAFAYGTCDDVTLNHGTATYTLRGRGELAPGITTWQAIRAALTFVVTEYTMDFSVDIANPDGTVDHVVRENRPVSHYLRR